MKKLLIILLIIPILGCTKQETKKQVIITTNFPAYDFTRAIVKNSKDIEVKLLIKPGIEIHDFEPTPKDIIEISKSTLFIYNGGESDEWIDDVLKNTGNKETIKMMDLVKLKEEKLVEGMEGEEEKEIDEHIWTSPVNAIEIVNKIESKIEKINPKEKKLYQKNRDNYTKEIQDIESEIRTITDNSKRKEIIFGDRFPIKYFTDEYGLKYYAAFKGCSHQTEASTKTITFLINKIKEDKIPVVFKIEMSSGKIAETISKETKAKVLEFNSAHNISEKDLNQGITYVDIMKKNAEALKEALNWKP